MSETNITNPYLVKQFELFDSEAKALLAKNVDSVLATDLALLAADAIERTAMHVFSEVYMASVALLVDDVFDISFSNDKSPHRNWNRFSYLDGYIGHCCSDTANGGARTHILNGKQRMSRENRLTQKKRFVSDPRMHAFFVTPMLVGTTVVGALQLSFSEKKTQEVIDAVCEFMAYWSDQLTWIFFAEKTKHKAMLDTTRAISRTLDVKNEYQASHSVNVAKLAVHFLKEIAGDTDYITALFGAGGPVHGFTSLKVKLAALLHDTGKLAMSDQSFEVIKTLEDYCRRHLHPYYTEMTLGSVPAMSNISMLAALHHERPNGHGFPFGIPIEECMIEEQIIMLADMLDSMARVRPGGKNTHRYAFTKILSNLEDDRIAAKFTPQFHAVFISILQDYKDKSRVMRLPADIKELLGLTTRRPAVRKRTKPASLEIAIRQTLLSDGNSTTNRWVIAVAMMLDPSALPPPTPDGTQLVYIKAPELVRDGEKHWLALEGALLHEPFAGSIQIRLAQTTTPKLFFGSVLLPDSQPRENSYAVCEAISRAPSIGPIVAAFCDSSLLSSPQAIARLGQLLSSRLQNLNKSSRWQLVPPSTLESLCNASDYPMAATRNSGQRRVRGRQRGGTSDQRVQL